MASNDPCYDDDELPLYTSITEDKEPCCFCARDTIDPILYGKKITIDSITAHHFCLLLSSGLRLCDDVSDKNLMFGFAIDDIKREVRKASKVTCTFCELKGANISCWIRSCRKYYHLPCAMGNGCSYEFSAEYRSYCDAHYTLNPVNEHTPDDLCGLCSEAMGNSNRKESLQVFCCNNQSFYHRQCLRKMAFALTDDFECPNCDNKEQFRDQMLANGIFIPDLDYLPSPSIEDDDEISESPKPKKQRVEKNWIYDKTFETKAEAIDAIKQENQWGYHYENKTAAGIKVTYRCNFVKYRGQQCAAAIYLLYDAMNLSVHLYRTDSDHNHDDASIKSNAVDKIPAAIADEIRSMHNIGMKPKAILFNLVQRGINPPKKTKLVTFLTNLRKEKFGSEKLHYGTLENWLKEKSIIPEDKDEPFVVSYSVELNEEKCEDSKFRFLVSTQTLLQNAVGVEKMHTDATYKLCWQGFPILLIGMTDSDRKFHPFGVCVATNECAVDFEFLFRALKDGVQQLFSADIDPKVLICDAGKSIHNGCTSVFPHLADSIVMCWSHMRRNVVKNLSKYLRDKKKQNEFMNDVDCLQLARSRNSFDAAAELFLLKWKAESKPLIQYFEKEWLIKNRNWFEGFRLKTPSTNNALESKNKRIKDEHTLRERLEFSQFHVVLFDMVRQWSIEYTSKLNTINHGAPTMNLNLWTSGYNFARSNVKTTQRRTANHIIYSIHGDSIHSDFTKWTNFEHFKRSLDIVHTKFVYPVTGDNWAHASCVCFDGLKKYLCEHIVGISLRLKVITAPPEAKSIPLGQRRKRGRPAKAKGALERQ